MAIFDSIKEKISAVADAIREAGGTSDEMTLDDMPALISALSSGGSGGSSTPEMIIGEMTITSDLYATKKSFVVNVPKTPRMVFVYCTSWVSEVDRYAPKYLMALHIDSLDQYTKTGDIAFLWYSYRATAAESAAISTSMNESASRIFDASYATTDATMAAYLVCCTNNAVYFKTYGNYRFRVGHKYAYMIVF